jgi:hypothetical protein
MKESIAAGQFAILDAGLHIGYEEDRTRIVID